MIVLKGINQDIMNRLKNISLFLLLSALLFNCHTEDPGPIQEDSKTFSIIDFDRLEMGSAFNIQVEEGSIFKIKARGDRRNLNDLDVYKTGNTLIVEFKNDRNRKHDTYIEITMPALRGVNFSGASISVIDGFESEGEFDFYLSGASKSQLNAGYRKINFFISGASTLRAVGLGDEMSANLSGASYLQAFDFPVREATLKLSGASISRITASNQLNVTASGASHVYYHGNPTLNAEISGASKVQKD